MAANTKDWKPWLIWALALAAVAGLLNAAIRDAATEDVLDNTELMAQAWTQVARASVPGLDALLEHPDQDIDADTRVRLKRLERVSEVFRFRVLDAHGNQVLASDRLEDADAGVQLGWAPSDHPLAASSPARNGSYVRLFRESRPGWPQAYSEVFVPVVRDGRLIGGFELYIDQTERLASADREHLRIASAGALALALLGAVGGWQVRRQRRAQIDAEQRTRYLARHDVLTGLLNRSSFNEALAQAWSAPACASAGSYALLCLDLDRFKEINDTHGHAAGDAVLCQAAERLTRAVRQGDLVARLGGDEFAILQAQVGDGEAVVALAQRIVDVMALPFQVADTRLYCTVSVGMALHGLDGTAPKDLLHKADMALYRAKEAGRNGYSFYDAAMDRQLHERRTLMRDLREAVACGQMALHYQPLYAADGRTLQGHEALVRWHHPERGLVSPALFIPVAEETGLIHELGRWILERACADAATWPAPQRVAVNLSTAQFRHGDLVAIVRGALQAAALAPQRLELEITESLLMSDTEQAVATLTALSALGVHIAMDDFGTGYSSLAYLWRFPFEKLKIDRSFTQSLGSDDKVELIVRSVISLAHSMGIRVNAEGVETVQQMRLLQAWGCDELQGFLLGRPMPLQALARAASPAPAPAPAEAAVAG